MTKEEILNLNNVKKYELIMDGKYINIFLEDADEIIRATIAIYGHKLDILINDESQIVRNKVIQYCEIYSEKPECRKILQLYKLDIFNALSNFISILLISSTYDNILNTI